MTRNRTPRDRKDTVQASNRRIQNMAADGACRVIVIDLKSEGIDLCAALRRSAAHGSLREFELSVPRNAAGHFGFSRLNPFTLRFEGLPHAP
jgi:hypothetical protein